MLWGNNQSLENLYFLIFLNLIWAVISSYTRFYSVKRTTTVIRILSLLFGQTFLFCLAYYAYFTIFSQQNITSNEHILLLYIVGFIFVNKFVTFYALKLYRKFGRNYRRVVVIGQDAISQRIIQFFNTENNYGYRYLGYYSDEKIDEKKYLGTLAEIDRVLQFKEPVDEIYCSPNVINEEKRKELIWFAKSNNIRFKILPNVSDFYSKNIDLEYYHTIPVYSVKELPFEKPEIRFVKRIFDILFSLFIIIFILSWFYPILWIVIKLESKGPAIFKQKREGLNGKDFNCFKFRSMRLNNESDVKSAQKNDQRITKVGSILRKTSMDELPQFFNVLKGEMSVVGPRPHMTKQSKGFQARIDNYYKRNAVKPGITGLAQISGYRGEIKRKSDIENRIRMDIFYIEKWSFLLDLKIILITMVNIFKGEERAY